jgi:Na+(H+)/acetate symporter ActP
LDQRHRVQVHDVLAELRVMTRYGGMSEWFGVRNISAALFGLPVGFAVMWAVSLMTPAPSQEVQDMVDEIRKPRGDTVLSGGDVRQRPVMDMS